MKTWTADEIRALPVVVDLTTAGSIFGIGRTRAHELARAGDFPVPVLRLGAQSYRVPVAPILRALGLDMDEARSAEDLTTVTTDNRTGPGSHDSASHIRAV